MPEPADLRVIDERAAEAKQRGADYVRVRRLSELVGATTLYAYAALCYLLAEERPSQYQPSIYST